jgi:hypothetical protein
MIMFIFGFGTAAVSLSRRVGWNFLALSLVLGSKYDSQAYVVRDA